MKHVSRVKLNNSEKEVAPSLTPWCSSYWKGSLGVALDNNRQLYYIFVEGNHPHQNRLIQACKETKLKQVKDIVIG